MSSTLQQSMRLQERKLVENKDKLYNKYSQMMLLFLNQNQLISNIRELYRKVPIDQQVMLSNEDQSAIVQSVRQYLNAYEQIVKAQYANLKESKIIADFQDKIVSLRRLQNKLIETDTCIRNMFEQALTDSQGFIINSNIKKKQIQVVQEEGFDLVDNVEYQNENIEEQQNPQNEQQQNPQNQQQQYHNQISQDDLFSNLNSKSDQNLKLLLQHHSKLQSEYTNQQLNTTESQLIIADIILQLYCSEFIRNQDKKQTQQQEQEQKKECLDAMLNVFNTNQRQL